MLKKSLRRLEEKSY